MTLKKKSRPRKAKNLIHLHCTRARWLLDDERHRLTWKCPYCTTQEELPILGVNPHNGLSLRFCYKTLTHYLIKIPDPPIRT